MYKEVIKLFLVDLAYGVVHKISKESYSLEQRLKTKSEALFWGLPVKVREKVEDFDRKFRG